MGKLSAQTSGPGEDYPHYPPLKATVYTNLGQAVTGGVGCRGWGAGGNIPPLLLGSIHRMISTHITLIETNISPGIVLETIGQ